MEFDLTKPYCHYFHEICQIPHGSKNEKALSDYVVAFAKDHGFEVHQDDMWNVVVRKPASKGYENAPWLMLQAHLDMVCEKEPGVEFDFEKDAIQTYVDENGWLRAKGTTLGADDGMGVAYMLAILDDDDLKHPPLECVFTVQEEIGLCGALGMSKDQIKSHRMVSLDGGGEVVTAVSSAGGVMAISEVPVTWTKVDGNAYTLTVTGLTGGHSGGLIDKEKGNANKIIARILREMASRGVKFNLVDVNGGEKDNAITRESVAHFVSCVDQTTIQASVDQTFSEVFEELEFSDAGVQFILEKMDGFDGQAMDDASSKRVVDFLYLIPHGMRHKSMKIAGLTLTSLNIGVVKTHCDHVMVNASIRSAMDNAVDDLVLTISTLASYFDTKVHEEARYPGWNYSEHSVMRQRFAQVFADLYDGQVLQERAGHGGTECSVFRKMYDDMDIISCGPISENAHTPQEGLNLESFDRAYKLLTTFIASVDKKETVCPKD